VTTYQRLRVLPLPRTEPPIIPADGIALELTTTESPYVQDALAINYSPEYTPDDDRYFDRQRSRSTELPDPRGFVPQLAQALVEVMVGARPCPQVIRWTSPEVYAVLARRALVAARRGLQHGRRPVVRRTRIHDIAEGVVEVAVVVVYPDRMRAMAMRLAGVDHRWVVTDLVIG
jgi:Family of unknown function (DUF6459)